MRHRRVWRLILSGVFAAVAVGLAAAAAFTRTEWGRGRVLEFTLQALGGRLNGVLVVDRLEGSLIAGARLHGVELRGADGELVVAADSAYVNYKLPSFFGGDMVLNSLVVYDPEVFLRRLPGDTLWNYQEILLDTTRTAETTRATLIDRAILLGAQITVRLPWEPEPGSTPAERRAEIREALTDSSRLEVERVPGGYLRTMRFQVADARVSDLVVAADERGGIFLRVDTLNALAKLYRGEPLDLRQARGTLALREGVLRFRAPLIVLPDSRLRAEGVVDTRGEEPAYDLAVRAERVRLGDMEWLYPYVPERGAASFALWLETRPDGTLYRVRDLRLDAPGTRVAGSFGLLVGQSLSFTDVDLVADPLRVRTIEEMLPTDLPVRGLQIGAVEIRSSGGTTRNTERRG